MLASEPFYASGTFWAGAGVVVALVAIVITVVLWRLGPPRRVLAYSVLGSTPLLSGDLWPGIHRAWFQVLMDGKPLADPYVTLLRVENHSRRDIRSSDFDQGKPLVFNLGAKFEYATDAGSTIDYKQTLKATDTAITVGPALIRGRQSLHMSIITEGRPSITCLNPPLVGVTVKEQGAGGASALIIQPTWTMMVLGLVVLLSVLVLLGSTAGIK